ncbi:MAG: hypothetical protein ABR577_07880 [Pyrinomonadaceae bacterium]
MSQNKPTGGTGQDKPSQTTGGAGTGATDAGTTRDTGAAKTGGAGAAAGGGSQSMTPNTGGSAQGAAGTAAGLQAQAQEYGQKITDAASQAKDYVADKVSVVGDKIKDLQNRDINEVADQAKDYARQNPGQAILISAGVGLVLGLLLRGGRR